MNRQELPIGVFDSGVGGLTVVAALRELMPDEDILYLGDTARVPYGTRSPSTVNRYFQGVAGHLVRRGIKALVVACNTATTYALDSLTLAGAQLDIPVVGVIAPGVEAAIATAKSHVGIIGTLGTIRGNAYAQMLKLAAPELQVTSIPCPLFVALAEEGWTEGAIANAIAERYLEPLKNGTDTLILGCTHYPLLTAAIAAALPHVTLVDSAHATAHSVSSTLEAHGLRRHGHQGKSRFLVTDNPERFIAVGTRFLGRAPQPTELIDLDALDLAAWARKATEESP